MDINNQPDQENARELDEGHQEAEAQGPRVLQP
jgi:hypothetical protein